LGEEPEPGDGKYFVLGFLFLAIVAFVGGCVVSRLIDGVK